MKKTKKDHKPQGRKSGYPSFKEIAYHHWRQNSPPMAGELIVDETERDREEEEGEELEEGERRWERNVEDEEPGEQW